jgi:hypothetical protein
MGNKNKILVAMFITGQLDVPDGRSSPMTHESPRNVGIRYLAGQKGLDSGQATREPESST